MLNNYGELEPVPMEVDSFDDQLREKCGAIAVHDPEGNAAEIARLGLTALQHRGQDGAGIAYTIHNEESSDVAGFGLKKALGRIASHFKKEEFAADIGYTENAVGHVRYPTTEIDNDYDGVQPIWINAGGKTYSIQHNGQFGIDNLDELAAEHRTGYIGSDSERFADLLGLHIEQEGHIEPAMHSFLPKLKNGAFSVTILSEEASYGIRDEHGMRPLVTGTLGDKKMIASEVTALKAPDKDGIPQLGFNLERVVSPGTFVVMDKDGFRQERWAEKDPSHCIFEDIYFSKPDNVMTEDGITVGEYRVNAGAILAHKETVKSDMIVPVLGSAKTYANGYEAACDVPQTEALQKNPDRNNPDSDRTFIEKTQEAREAAVRDKFIVDSEAVDGKSVTLVDDSLVRGTTTRVIIEMLREAGADKVHVRIGSPPYVKPCAFGVNVQSEEELLSYNRTISEMADEIGADSLVFLTRPEMLSARNVDEGEVCDGCVGGSYPQPKTENNGTLLPMAA